MGSKSDADVDSVRKIFTEVCAGGDVIYLEDEEHELHGIRIYGSPCSQSLDIGHSIYREGKSLQTSGKPFQLELIFYLSMGQRWGEAIELCPVKRIGCADLLAEVQGRIKPSFLVCGHVHEGAGVTYDGTTHFINASSLNEQYECVHSPLVFDHRLSP